MALIPLQNLLSVLHQERLQTARRKPRISIAAASVYGQKRAGRGRRLRTVWVKPWLQSWVFLAQYDMLMSEIMRESHGDFKVYLGMKPEMFREILVMVASRITKQGRRLALDPGLKLPITLHIPVKEVISFHAFR